jgi:threonine synthase
MGRESSRSEAAMRFVSTRRQSPPASFRTALFGGMAPDGGLYMPEQLDPEWLAGCEQATLVEVGTEIARHWCGGLLPRPALDRIIASALNFPIPLVRLHGRDSVLELFHGPTFAFKDVGARVMARLMAELNGGEQALTVLVATSGDTGGAVAQAFAGVAGTRVVVLFPDGGVTPVQEAQFTTLGGNVQAVAVAGTFDDCQRLAKEAFADTALRQRAQLTSANSINIGRLLPQTFYYAHAALSESDGVVFSVPSGNFGNLTAGVMASRMGAPIRQFVAATTINDTFARYIESGRYEPRGSVATLANAMDVGAPSNLERLRELFHDDRLAMQRAIVASVHTDDEVRHAIGMTWERHGYVCDPHTAIAMLGLQRASAGGGARIALSTAHPAKFRETVEPLIGRPVSLPPALATALERPRLVTKIAPSIRALMEVLD